MKVWRLAWNELRRIGSGRLSKAALLALACIPMLYGGLYLYANDDPYGKLRHVPAALVVEDHGVKGSDGRTVNVGNGVASDLTAAGTFAWHQVSAETARSGVRDGRYDFAITVPADFSAALTSASSGTPQRGVLTLTTNDANNYIARTLAGQVTERIRSSLARQVGSSAAGSFLLTFTNLRTDLGKAASGAGDLASGASQATTAASELTDGAATLVDGQRRLLQGTTDLASGSRALAAGAGTLATGTDGLASGLRALNAASGDLPARTRALATGAGQVATGSGQLATASGQVATGSAQLATANGQLATGTGQLVAGLTEYRENLRQALEALHAPPSTAAQLLGGLDQIRAGAATVDTGAKTVAARSTALASGAQQVASASASLSTGASQVATGTDALASGTPTLASAITQAATGADALRTGARSLATAAGKLRDGTLTLHGGTESALGGTSRLNAGSQQLTDGLRSLASGASQLDVSLGAGANRIPDLDQQRRSEVANAIADPVQIHTVAQSRARSYGVGLAPFFMSLATWIGGYVLFLFVRPLSTRAMAANQAPVRVALGGWLTPALLGVVQMLALFAFVRFGIRLTPAHTAGTIAFLALVSATFIALVHTLNAWLGVVGQFLGLVLMVLQLVSAGGTFPWQTLPGPLHALHVIMPMSYSVDALRHLMYGGSLAPVMTDALVLGGYLVAALVLTTLAARRMRIWTPSRIKPEITL